MTSDSSYNNLNFIYKLANKWNNYFIHEMKLVRFINDIELAPGENHQIWSQIEQFCHNNFKRTHWFTLPRYKINKHPYYSHVVFRKTQDLIYFKMSFVIPTDAETKSQPAQTNGRMTRGTVICI
jgi:hypothetical protein